VSGQDVTVTFSSSQYTNLQNIASTTYIVPTSIWSTVGDPGKYADANPVGSGPYDFSSITAAGITLTANPDYWGSVPVPTVEFPVYASNTTVLSALTSNSLDWAGNFITGLKAAFITPSPSTHHDWFPGTQDQQHRAEPDQVPDQPAAGPRGDQSRDRPHQDRRDR